MPDTITGTTSAAASLTASLTALLAEFGGLWQDGRGWWRSPFLPATDDDRVVGSGVCGSGVCCGHESAL